MAHIRRKFFDLITSTQICYAILKIARQRNSDSTFAGGTRSDPQMA
jgi:hypothetical protein